MKLSNTVHVSLLFQMKVNFDMRQVIAKGNTLAAFRDAMATLKERLAPFHEGREEFEAPEEIRLENL